MKTRILAISFALLLVGTSAHAEPPPEDDFARNGWYVGAWGVYALNHYRSTAGADYKGSPGARIRAGYRGAKWYALEVDVEWLHQFKDKNNSNNTARVITGGVNAKFFPWGGRFQPYGLIGVGGMGVKSKNPPQGGDFSDTDWGFRFGLGIDMYATRNIAIGLEGSYVLGAGDTWDSDYTSYGLGVTYRF